MSRYNMRTLRGERIAKKKESSRILHLESNFEFLVNNPESNLSETEVIKEIVQTFKNNAIEQSKISLICPLTKERIQVPARYRSCRHLQCFDLKGFLAMKSKRNFLECPICNIRVDNELTDLCVDKYFERVLLEVAGVTDVQVLRDGSFTAIVAHPTPIVPKEIDDEELYVPENIPSNEIKSETFRNDVKSEIEIIEIEAAIEQTSGVAVPDSDDPPELSDNHPTMESKRGRFSRSKQDLSQVLESDSLATFIVDDQNEHQPGLEESLNESATDDNDSELEMEESTVSKNENHSEISKIKVQGNSKQKVRPQFKKTRQVAQQRIGQKRYKCEQCDYATDRKYDLGSHVRHIHTEERPFKCKQCDYTTAYRSVLIKHERRHTGVMPFKCKKCDYATARLQHLIIHERKHTGERPYKCEKCDYAAAQHQHLIVHKRKHTGERPYKCEKCDYAATNRSVLIVHERKHTGERPYKCEKCDYAAANRSNLIEHQGIHSEERPYRCPFCQIAFYRRTKLNRHMRRQLHKENVKLHADGKEIALKMRKKSGRNV